MPLFTLKNINNDHFDELSKSILEELGIPDPEDREWRLENDPGGEKTVTISFTTGPEEYPDFSNPAFEPTDETIKLAGESFLKKAGELNPGITKVELQAWKPGETTFDFRPFRIEKPIKSLDFETKEQLAKNVEGLNTTLVVPQRLTEGRANQPVEGETIAENPFASFGNEVNKRIVENLGLTENTISEIKIEVVQDCQTDLSIEVDFKTKKTISKEVREYLAGELAAMVDEKYPPEKLESATIWIRQDDPKTIIVS